MYDKNFIAELYDRHGGELLVYILSYVKSQEAAEDVLHDVFVKLMRYSAGKELHRKNPRALLYSIARTMSIDFLRKNRRLAETAMEEPAAPENPVHDALERAEIREKVEKAMERMKENTRSVFIMRSELNLGFADIAANLGISERTAKREMKRALALIAGDLEKSGLITFLSLLLALLPQVIV